MELAPKRILNLAMVAAGLILFAYGYYLNYRSSISQEDNRLAQEIVAHKVNAVDRSNIPIPDGARSVEQPAVDAIDNRPEKLAFPEYQDLVRWDSERGYMSGEDFQIYESYSEQTLKDLSSSGDVKAMLMLGHYYIQDDYRPEEANVQFYKAAVHGSTVALTYLASQAQIDMISTGADKTPEGLEQGVIEILANYKVEALRGDEGGARANINAYKAVYKTRYGQELVIEQEQLDKIDQRAMAIYDELLFHRRELGLGDFDNSTPAVLKKNYEDK